MLRKKALGEVLMVDQQLDLISCHPSRLTDSPYYSSDNDHELDLKPPQTLIALLTSSSLYETRSKYSIQQEQSTTPSFSSFFESSRALSFPFSANSLNVWLEYQASCHGFIYSSRRPSRVLLCHSFSVSDQFSVMMQYCLNP